MASSKLGRLRQWAEEKISAKEKPVISEELRELEKDIELRKEGIQRLILASQKYHHALSKKKACPGVGLDDADKMLPIDILGVVMIHHGEEFGEESAFGSSLLKLGRAHCKIATLQEAFALTFKDTFLASLERFRDEIREYEALRRKVETRRLALDAASAKYDKLQHSKKEKDRREAEDELERTKQRYEETSEDIRAHMHAIQENEHAQFRALVAFLELEMNFAQGYVDVLREVRGEVAGLERSDSRKSNYSTHTKSKPASKATPQLQTQTQLPTTPPPKALALAGLAGLPPQPLKLTNKLGLQADTSTTTISADSSSSDEEGEGEGAYEDQDDDQEREEDGEMGHTTPSRRSVDSRRGSTSSKHKEKERDKTPSSSRPPSRTRSRLSFSRKRTNSAGNVSAEALKELEDAAPSLVTPAAGPEEGEKAKDKEGKDKEKEKRTRRMSLGGWTFGGSKSQGQGSASVPASGATTPNASSSTPTIPTASASTGSLGRTAKRKSTKRRKSRDREAFTVLADGDGDEWEEGGGSTTDGGGGGRGLRKSGSFSRALGRRRSRSKSGSKTLKGKEGRETKDAKEGTPSLSHSHSGSSLSMASTFSSTSVDAASTTSTSTATASHSADANSKSKILKPPSSQGRKLLRAVYDFDATSPDEMSFKRGEEIVVLQEVVDEWWLGEVLGGEGEGDEGKGEKQERRRGLFPRSYTEVVGSVAGPLAPPLASGGASSSGPTTPSGEAAASSKPKNARRGSSGQSASASGSMSMSNISVRGPGGFIAALFGGSSSSSAGSPKAEAAPVPAALAGAGSRGPQDLRDSQVQDHEHEQEDDDDHHHHRHAHDLDAYTSPASDDDLHLRNPNAQPMGIKSPVYFGRFDQVGQGPNEVDTASFTDADTDLDRDNRGGERHGDRDRDRDRDSMADTEASEDDTFGFKQQMREIEEREEAARRFLASRKPGRWDVGGGENASTAAESSGDEASFHTGSSASLVKGSGGSGGSKGKGSEEDSGWDHVARPTPKQMGTGGGTPTPKLGSRTVPTTPVLTPKKVPGPGPFSLNFKGAEAGQQQQLHGPGLSSSLGSGLGSGMGMGMGRSLSDNPALHSSSASSTSSHSSSAAAVALTPTTPHPPSNGLLAPPSLNLSASTASMSSTASSAASGASGASAGGPGAAKRIPPPPPPRRTPSHTPGSNVPPALPSRPAGHRSTTSTASQNQNQSQSASAGGLSTPVSTASSSVHLGLGDVNATPRAKSAQGQIQGLGGGGLGYDRSPFESAVELGGESDGGGGSVESSVEGKPKSRNPFRV